MIARLLLGVVLAGFQGADTPPQVPPSWTIEFPKADFSKHSVPYSEILSGGPPRDGIAPIDAPRFKPVESIDDISPEEPVISFEANGQARAYPFRILMFHEIVNDRIKGLPIAVTYCPLCNSAMVFDRRVDGQVLDFGTSGRLMNSNLVMYDRQTESFWQQFTGTAVIGTMTGAQLTRLPARIESFRHFAERHEDGRVLAPPTGNRNPYGLNPYQNYDSQRQPAFRTAELPDDVPALARVVNVGDRAYALSYVRQAGEIKDDGLVIRWSEGQNSALDHVEIAKSRDVGNVTVQKRRSDGSLAVIPYSVDFAFAFKSFYPDAPIITADERDRRR